MFHNFLSVCLFNLFVFPIVLQLSFFVFKLLVSRIILKLSFFVFVQFVCRSYSFKSFFLCFCLTCLSAPLFNKCFSLCLFNLFVCLIVLYRNSLLTKHVTHIMHNTLKGHNKNQISYISQVSLCAFLFNLFVFYIVSQVSFCVFVQIVGLSYCCTSFLLCVCSNCWSLLLFYKFH